MRLILNWILLALAVAIVAYILPGVEVVGWVPALVAAVIIGAMNAFIRPILIILTLPITILTFGLFVLVINSLLALFSAFLVPGFFIDGFWWALAFVVLLSLVNGAFEFFTEKGKKENER